MGVKTGAMPAAHRSTGKAAAGNRVVVYSAAFRPFCLSLIRGFEAAHPDIELDFIDGVSTVLHERYLDSCARGAAGPDVIWSSAVDQQLTLALQGLAQPHGSVWTERLPAWARFGDLAFATSLEPLCTLIHSGHLPADAPAGTIQELAALLERHASTLMTRVGAFNIHTNGLGFLAMLIARKQPADFRRFLAALAASQPRLYDANPPMVEALAGQRIYVGINVLKSFADRAVARHPELRIAGSRAPLQGIPRLALITAQAPHPGPARAFLDYLLSDEGQAMMALDALFPLFGSGSGSGDVVPLALNQDVEPFLAAEHRDGLSRDWQPVASARTLDA